MASYWDALAPHVSDASQTPLGDMSEEQKRLNRFGQQNLAGMTDEQRQQARFYQLAGMVQGADQLFAPERQRQEAAVGALGERAATMRGSTALLAQQAQQEAAQRQAAASPQAILAGSIGQQAAQGMGAFEQEAAQRQMGYLRGLQSLGAGLMTEAEQRRAAEAEIQRDIQARFLAAQRIAASQAQRERAESAASLGRYAGVGGAILGGLAGIPAGPAGVAAGASAGYSLGSKVAQ